MKYIEIADGLSVETSKIEAVERAAGNVSVIHTHHKTYNSTFPYEVILSLLENNRQEEAKEPQQEGLNILKQIGTFAG